MALIVRYHTVGRISLAEHGIPHLVNAPANAILRLVEPYKKQRFSHGDALSRVGEQGAQPAWYQAHTDGAHEDALNMLRKSRDILTYRYLLPVVGEQAS
ncbi:hypothetical protein F2Q70_00026349 [Brassica cretica]|uniref:Uncharacterized protein n=1 Tax=Brassica cretica TaxID=69181 RepID=A0A8S9IAT7_BRACR|nr:hypothetical protein F2Q68_00025908 [Brassica cretica]KAF2602910.1 hypothetical protein F2Q70_00026349 [Brassica cretica]